VHLTLAYNMAAAVMTLLCSGNQQNFARDV